MAFKAHKEFFDASVFLGMRSADGVRKACKRFFALRFRGAALTSLDQVGKCDCPRGAPLTAPWSRDLGLCPRLTVTALAR